MTYDSTSGETFPWKVAIIALLLLLLWVPVSIDKLLDFHAFRGGILRQPFSDTLGTVLVWTLPPLEIAAVVLLVMDRTRYWGVWLSAVLMAGFTAYVGIALLGAWEKLPCGCGSVIAALSWRQHFFFNLTWLSCC